ncbi:MAG: hypothetical protein WC379_11240 [Methanoregula sp.]
MNGKRFGELIHNKAFLPCIVVVGIPALVQLLFILRFGVNVVYCDQWNFVPIIDKWYSGSLTVSDLISQDAEHRYFFPRIVMLILALGTHYNTVAEMIVSWIILILTTLIILWIYVRSSGISVTSALGFLPVMLLLFNFRQHENILWGWQISYYLAIFFFILALFLLERSEEFGPSFCIALVCAVLSSFSAFFGLFTWVVCFIFLLIIQRKRELILAWGLAGIFTFMLYFWQWQKPVGNPVFFPVESHPFQGALFFFLNVGAPLSYLYRYALLSGLAILCLCGIVIWISRKEGLIRRHTPWISFLLFSLLTSGAILIGRGGLGDGTALWSRYTTVTVLGVIGMYLMYLDIFRSYRAEKPVYSCIFILVAVLVIAGALSGYVGGVQEGENLRIQRVNASDAILHYQNRPLVLPEMNQFADPEFIPDQVQKLDQYHLNVFYRPGL